MVIEATGASAESAKVTGGERRAQRVFHRRSEALRSKTDQLKISGAKRLQSPHKWGYVKVSCSVIQTYQVETKNSMLSIIRLNLLMEINMI